MPSHDHNAEFNLPSDPVVATERCFQTSPDRSLRRRTPGSICHIGTCQGLLWTQVKHTELPQQHPHTAIRTLLLTARGSSSFSRKVQSSGEAVSLEYVPQFSSLVYPLVPVHALCSHLVLRHFCIPLTILFLHGRPSRHHSSRLRSEYQVHWSMEPVYH